MRVSNEKFSFVAQKGKNRANLPILVLRNYNVPKAHSRVHHQPSKSQGISLKIFDLSRTVIPQLLRQEILKIRHSTSGVRHQNPRTI